MTTQDRLEVRVLITPAEAQEVRALAQQLGIPFALMAGAALRAGLNLGAAPESPCR